MSVENGTVVHAPAHLAQDGDAHRAPQHDAHPNHVQHAHTYHAHTAIVAEPINVTALLQRVSDVGAGAITLFLGTVREVNDGRAVTGIDYEAYGPMAQSELEAIARELLDTVPDLRLAIEHRVGTLTLGDVSVAIAAAHAHRAQALDASRAVIEAIKKRVPVWKREHYAEGDWHWIDPTANASPSGRSAS